MHPAQLEEWLKPLQARFSADEDLLGRAAAALASSHFSQSEIQRLRYLVGRGSTVNNPHIPWAYVQSHGMKIESDFSRRLRELVHQYPLK